ncbi:mitochondrial substrate carrier protein [Raphidocelis subcapitata]|uniref:Mitochondrial substrate carrier protein n=1 Tax=Raphidocelis subcapitata TaxID=307507 RepID=A0A2V0P153_9CHLO|nr:mitochondrial substrate carrier protein [Raphidocelis subcapitata]|eukprot:GBF93299.1 mitochondrial substrate carrier protein [Raphidocelis subcapitata]
MRSLSRAPAGVRAVRGAPLARAAPRPAPRSLRASAAAAAPADAAAAAVDERALLSQIAEKEAQLAGMFERRPPPKAAEVAALRADVNALRAALPQREPAAPPQAQTQPAPARAAAKEGDRALAARIVAELDLALARAGRGNLEDAELAALEAENALLRASARALLQHQAELEALLAAARAEAGARVGGPAAFTPDPNPKFEGRLEQWETGKRPGRLPRRWRVDPVDVSARSLFESIDADGKGHITEGDLRAYAAAHGLPPAYVRPFMDALLAAPRAGPADAAAAAAAADTAAAAAVVAPAGGGHAGGGGGGGGGHASGGGGAAGLESVPAGGAGEVGFKRFRSFVVSREQGLREAFEMFDKDRDGAISYADLDATLRHVAVRCPSSRCVLRCRRDLVSELLARLDTDGSRDVDFEEFRDWFALLPQNDASLVVEYWLGAAAAGLCADTGTRITVQEATRRGSPAGHLLAGAVAGAVSRTATAPLETVRLSAMAGGLPAGGRIDAALSALMQSHGWRALYKGNAVNVMRSAPQKALDFFTFDLYKSLLSSPPAGGPCGRRGEPSLQQTFLAAGLAGGTSCLLLYPLETARMRLTLDTAGRYSGLLHCLRSVVAAEGPAALFRGLGPSLAAIFPEAAITYGLHDVLKRVYRRVARDEPGIGASLAAGVLSASIGQITAYPLETISRRMQLGAAPRAAAAAAGGGGGGAAAAAAALPAGGGGAGASAWQIAAAIWRENGVRGLYAGIGAATLRLVPMAVVSFGVYEAMRALLVQAEASWDRHVADLEFEERHGTAAVAAAAAAAGQAARIVSGQLQQGGQQQQGHQQQQGQEQEQGREGGPPPRRWWRPRRPAEQQQAAAPLPPLSAAAALGGVCCGGEGAGWTAAAAGAESAGSRGCDPLPEARRRARREGAHGGGGGACSCGPGDGGAAAAG